MTRMRNYTAATPRCYTTPKIELTCHELSGYVKIITIIVPKNRFPYEETKAHLEDNDWKRLLKKDQLNIEKEAGRVFNGWKEGKILFVPTYKYTQNSDSYAGETVKSKKKRRTPAWCDRILWHGSIHPWRVKILRSSADLFSFHGESRVER